MTAAETASGSRAAPRDGIAIEGLLLVYDAPPLTEERIDAISLPVDELEQWAWCDDSQLFERLPAHMLRRITAARHARSNGATRYLENGSIGS